MKINKTIMMACIASFCTLSLVTGCSSDTIDETPGDSNNSNDETTYLDGYAHPDGVIILNQGARVSQNSTITYISPEGTIEEYGRCTVHHQRHHYILRLHHGGI